MYYEPGYRLAAAILLTVIYSVSIFFRRRADKAGGCVARQEGTVMLAGLRLGALLLLLNVLVYLINPGWMQWASWASPGWLRWTGAGLSALMVPSLYWMFISLGNNITPTTSTRPEHTLVTTGPYRWIRHPLYSFAALFWLGISLLTANWFLSLMITPLLAVLVKRTTTEEEKLLERFGDSYRDYRSRTGRFFPRIFT